MCTNSVTTGAASEAGSSNRPTKLFIGGISRHTTTKQLRDHFTQFGRVLDCVAMRTPDGHPRGFGYVTLDSLAAAENCLREPQLIDNRIVDMKLAIPEGSGTSPTGSAKGALFNMSMHRGAASFNVDMFHNGQELGEWPDASAAYGDGFSWWPEETVAESGHDLDCMELLCSTREMSGFPAAPNYQGQSGEHIFNEYSELAMQQTWESTGLLLPPILSSEPNPSHLSTRFHQTPQMSASAPEFVPQNVQDPGKTAVSTSAKVQKSGRAPLGELTNIVQAEDLLKPFKSPSKQSHDTALGTLSPSATQADATGHVKKSRPRRTGLLLDDEDVSSAGEIYEDSVDEDASDEKANVDCAILEHKEGNSEDVQRQISLSSTDVDENVEQVEDDLTDLPSLGSAQHAIGECKRCNFFAKGRCANGKDCEFCHFLHDKRKLSRQEKRERRAAYQMEDASENHGGYNAVDMDETDGAMASRPVFPPGLLPWQPETETILSSQPMLHPLAPSGYFENYTFQQIVSSAPLTSAVLSTSPSPVISAASTPFPTPVPTPTAANSMARTMFSAHAVGASSADAQTGTCGWQRSGDEDGMGKLGNSTNTETQAKYCGPNTAGHLSNQYSRDELLQLRNLILKKSDNASSFCIRMQTITASGSDR